MKKLFAIILAVSMLAAFALTADAAITTDEKALLDLLSQKITMKSGTVVSLADVYINQAEDYLTKADLTKQQCEEIATYVKAAQAAVESSDAKNLSLAATSVKNEVIAEAKLAANVVNAELHVSKIGAGSSSADADYKLVLVFTDESTVDGYTEGKSIELTLTDDCIIQTGAEGNMTATVVGSAVLLVAVAFVIVASRKKALSK